MSDIELIAAIFICLGAPLAFLIVVVIRDLKWQRNFKKYWMDHAKQHADYVMSDKFMEDHCEP